MKGVEIKHASGCYTTEPADNVPISASSNEAEEDDTKEELTEVIWNFVPEAKDHPRKFGVLAIICGALIALRGRRWFPWIAALLAFLCVLDVTVAICLHSKWWDGTFMGSVSTLLFACVIGIPLAMLVRKYIWICVGLNGIIMGALAGFFIYTIILASTGWE